MSTCRIIKEKIDVNSIVNELSSYGCKILQRKSFYDEKNYETLGKLFLFIPNFTTKDTHTRVYDIPAGFIQLYVEDISSINGTIVHHTGEAVRTSHEVAASLAQIKVYSEGFLEEEFVLLPEENPRVLVSLQTSIVKSVFTVDTSFRCSKHPYLKVMLENIQGLDRYSDKSDELIWNWGNAYNFGINVNEHHFNIYDVLLTLVFQIDTYFDKTGIVKFSDEVTELMEEE